jgi:hypothetical protein
VEDLLWLPAGLVEHVAGWSGIAFSELTVGLGAQRMQILAQAVKRLGLVFPGPEPFADQPGAYGGDGAERVEVNGEDGAGADRVRDTGFL